jgi:hypothetical protein
MTRIESFSRMFDPTNAHGEKITRVEIPLIQRDYAQGRRGEKVDAIRESFLDVLHGAIAGEHAEPVGLDFVYGELGEDGTLQPLDGQQRLTTLFLLHWYLAVRTGNLSPAVRWTNFTYETRPSARRFCQRLVSAQPPATTVHLSAWIRDQPWYLYVWRYDPTINSMLVMLDAIDERFASVDAQRAWGRLTDTDNPGIWFHLLPLPDMGSAEALYVKMNSRGKPLTEFENFKARFEKVIGWSSQKLQDEFALKADTFWSDVFWRFRGADDLVDDEFLRYFQFVTEVCEWSEDGDDLDVGRSITARARRVFGSDNPQREDHLGFLFTAFDVWVGRDIAAEFETLFSTATTAAAFEGALRLFFRDTNPNLFESACRSYGETAGGGARTFSFGQTLLLLAVVLRLSPAFTGTDADFAARIRTLRNLVEASQFELRAERMPRLVADTRALILDGVLPTPGNSFAVAQISDESDKREFLVQHPEAADAVMAVEDNYLLRGSTSSFALDAASLGSRGATFNALMAEPDLWWDLTGALLTFGDYQWPRQRGGTLDDSDAFQFGTWDRRYADAWREVLVGRTRAECGTTAAVLQDFLDAVAATPDPTRETLKLMQTAWLSAREDAHHFDWRYYLVKYPAMRAGASGLYYAHGRRMGFSLTNLPGGKKYRNANYLDPYLQAIFEAAGKPTEVGRLTFSGYEWDPRWLRLTRSGVGLRSIPNGFEIAGPTADEFQAAFDTATRGLDLVAVEDAGSTLAMAVRKTTPDATGPDSEDRVQVGAHLLRRLIDAGL